MDHRDSLTADSLTRGLPALSLAYWGERISGAWRYTLLLALDGFTAALAFYLGYWARFDGQIPGPHLEAFWRAAPLLVLARVLVNLPFGIHRWSFRFSGLSEALKIVGAALAGTASFLTVGYLLQRPSPPRSVMLIELLLSTALMGAFRFSPRFVYGRTLQRQRERSGVPQRVLIVGAGSAGELLLRDLGRSDEHSYEVVGFVDDNPSHWGASIGGRKVLGPLSALPELVSSRKVRELLFAIPHLPPARFRDVIQACSNLQLGYKMLPVSFSYLNDRVSAAMLRDVSPEQLLQRSQTVFEPQEVRALLQERCLMVSGASGTIGSEICRQAARAGARSLVLVDMDENNLYLLCRDLQARHPELEVVPAVADVRDAGRLLQIAREHRPQDVFHAAAHKHVPLMELAPGEAVKNNVIGCLNAVQMADACGVDRFVLVSTDKAVNPTSVMGATKRIAELIVRHFAATSATSFTAVRFGNVLGSAGSVVPLFKAQIAAGGPVTVTHPECRRYMMTISEAVGLVLIAGLGRYGDLCILEMGEPIRILDLARLMITLAGRIPEREIPITFTGLRPGEKLDEQLLTELEAASSQQVRETIRSVHMSPPASRLLRDIERLQGLALADDRDGLLALMASIDPSLESLSRLQTPSATRLR